MVRSFKKIPLNIDLGNKNLSEEEMKGTTSGVRALVNW